MTPLPGQLEAPQLLNKVTKAQNFSVSMFDKLSHYAVILTYGGGGGCMPQGYWGVQQELESLVGYV